MLINYRGLKALAKRLGRSVNDLLALSKNTDPFYADLPYRKRAGEWFGEIYIKYGGERPHQRRIHYRISTGKDIDIRLPNGDQYRNTHVHWKYLAQSSLAARYLDLIPPDGLIDMRNDPPSIYAKDVDPSAVLAASSAVYSELTRFDLPELPMLPWLGVDGFRPVQNYILETWIEKSTQNDWLDPLCRRRGVNLCVGIGEQSEIRARELALRSARYKAPVRVLYISDFDPGGRSMPKAIARKVEFAIRKLGLDVDFQLIPVALTPEQVQHYDLPRIPIKDTERRKDKFEETFGVGAIELDALEALYPGELARIVEAEMNNWLDPGLERRVLRIESDQRIKLSRITERVRERHENQIAELTGRFNEILDEFREWEDEADDLGRTIADDL